MVASGMAPLTVGMGSDDMVARLNELAGLGSVWGGRAVNVGQEVLNLRVAAVEAARQVVSQGEAALGQARVDAARELQHLHDGLANSLGQI
eukprot:11181891-Lingulodinium_polyedra.AAC.1